ncbi:exosome component 5 [Chytriomyces sp. MP71]|nr:exosome component 5 [Chytriomyces sp. MP71]
MGKKERNVGPKGMVEATTTLRSDNRTSAHQLRPPTTTLSPLSRSDGSARFSFGGSAVLASVYGPKEVKLRDEQLDVATVEVLFRPLIGLSGTTERLYEKTLREIVEGVVLRYLHPRTCVQVTLQVMSDDGCILSCAINAAILALLDAGVALKNMVASVTCVIDQEGQLLLDPSAKEAKEAASTHIFTFDNVTDDIVNVVSMGVYSVENYKSACELAQQACASIQAVYRQTLEEKINKA